MATNKTVGKVDDWLRMLEACQYRRMQDRYLLSLRRTLRDASQLPSLSGTQEE